MVSFLVEVRGIEPLSISEKSLIMLVFFGERVHVRVHGKVLGPVLHVMLKDAFVALSRYLSCFYEGSSLS